MWSKRRVLETGVTIGLVYLAVCVVARVSYRRALYPAPRAGPLAVPPGATLLTLQAEDGSAVRALDFPAPEGANTLVHFHGNGETIEQSVAHSEWFHARGLGVMLVEYRGYGVSSSGTPTEEGLYQDATAALDALARRDTGADKVVLWGTSLGTGVAAEMAARGRGARLVLVSPFTSVSAMAARFAPILPTRLIVGDRFDTLSKASRIRIPTIVIHGDRDEVVPYAMGQTVSRSIAKATLTTVPGAGHNDLFARDGPHLLAAILAHAAAHN
jgi:fermentation-respiration switch protein FrsA (DUF1100 family)